MRGLNEWDIHVDANSTFIRRSVKVFPHRYLADNRTEVWTPGPAGGSVRAVESDAVVPLDEVGMEVPTEIWEAILEYAEKQSSHWRARFEQLKEERDWLRGQVTR